MATRGIYAPPPLDVPHRTTPAPTRSERLVPLALGTLGSLLMLLGSLGVGFLGSTSPVRSWPVVAAARSSATLIELGAVTLVTGGLLLLVAWLRLRTVATSAGEQGLRTVLVAAVAWSAPLLVSVPVFSRDLYAYVGQGRLMLAGVDPYTSGIAMLPGWFALGVDPLWANSPTPYGPLYLLVEAFAVLVGGDAHPEVSIAILRAVSVAGAVAFVVYCLRIARLRGISQTLTAWTVAANPLTVILFVAAAHNDALMLAFILAGLFHAMRGHRAASVLLVGCAIAVKPVAIIALPVLAIIWLGSDESMRSRIRMWAASAAGALGFVAVLGALTGVGMGWVGAMVVPGAVEHWYAPMSLVTTMTASAAQLVGLDPEVPVALVKLLALLTAGGVTAALMLSRRPMDPLARMTGAFLAFLTASTAIHPWYAMWVLPIAALSLRWRPSHVHLAVYATLFLTFVSLGEPVDGSGIALDTVSSRVVTITALAVVGLNMLMSYTRDEEVDFREVGRSLPFAGAFGELVGYSRPLVVARARD